MKIKILLILAVIIGTLGAAGAGAAEQTQGARPSDDPDATWGLHEPYKDCVACHGDQTSQGPPDKSNLVAELPRLCYSCHAEYASPEAWEHGPVATRDCLLCHDAHNTKNKSLLNKPVPELCHHCHETKTLDLVPDHSQESHVNCTDCHESHSSPGRMLLKQSFLKTEAGRAFLANSSAARPRPTFVDRLGSLGGLEGVAVVTEIDASDSIKRCGVTEELIKAKVEQQLKSSGIRILSDKEKTPQDSELYVHLRLVEVPSQRRPGQADALSGSFNISLRQTVELLAPPGYAKRRFCTAATWDTGAVVIWGIGQTGQGIDQAVKVLVGRFGKDYAKANPVNETLASGPSGN